MTHKGQRKHNKGTTSGRAQHRLAMPVAKAQAPRFDPTLPTTKAAIEAEIEQLLPQMLEAPALKVERHEEGRTIYLSPPQAQLMRLQLQLFRAVFDREPGPHDPIFWDAGREKDGAFFIDPMKDARTSARYLSMTDIRPEVAYAMALTGIAPMKSTSQFYEEDDIEEWQAAVDDYLHQKATGVIPLIPDEFIHAWSAVGDKARLERELGTYEKAVAAANRIAALETIMLRTEFKPLLSPDGYSVAAIVAAASAEVHKRTAKFNVSSFRAKLSIVDWYDVNDWLSDGARLMTRERLCSTIAEFRRIIDGNCEEEIVQSFIEDNQIMLAPFAPKIVFVKPPILNRRRADFGILNSSNELVLIEIERPGLPLFRKDGTQTADLTHAFGQPETWHHEVTEHRGAVFACITGCPSNVSEVRYVVIAGRSRPEDAESLTRLARTSKFCRFMTYDNLIGDVENAVRAVWL
jgi:Domain of unknown function (DUF4263)